MKTTQLILLLLALGFANTPSAAIKYDYPLGTRTVFLSGCLTDKSDKPLQLEDATAVQRRMRTCLCMLDKFQEEYTSERFMKAFKAMDDGSSHWRQRELKQFVEKIVPHCL